MMFKVELTDSVEPLLLENVSREETLARIERSVGMLAEFPFAGPNTSRLPSGHSPVPLQVPVALRHAVRALPPCRRAAFTRASHRHRMVGRQPKEAL